MSNIDQSGSMTSPETTPQLTTRIVEINSDELGQFEDKQTLERWIMPTAITQNSSLTTALQEAAKHLRTLNTPVAFPTETVYGLGADATNSNAVKGIYKAKGRPSDNPLIIHVCDLTMLREVIAPDYTEKLAQGLSPPDPIPEIYKPLIKRFWPGPLTLLLPNSINSKLAYEVTAGLSTFAVRMPDSSLALSLISLTGKPLAAPSANASTKPSPTTASHVLNDLSGKIELIINGGLCKLGVESTVVDGLCQPPVVLRPGGVNIDVIRECEGWHNITTAYQDCSENMPNALRAPGMKYKHYSPKAQIVLYEPGLLYKISSKYDSQENLSSPKDVSWQIFEQIFDIHSKASKTPVKIGIVRTRNWDSWGGLNDLIDSRHPLCIVKIINALEVQNPSISFELRKSEIWILVKESSDGNSTHNCPMNKNKIADLFEIALGSDSRHIAQSLFASLRQMDECEVSTIFVEGIEEDGDLAAAVINRLRKAASFIK